MARTIQNQVLYIGLATAAIASVLFYIYVSQIDPKKELKEDRTKKGKKESDDTASPTSTPSKEQSTTTQAFDELKTPIVRNSASTKKVIEAPEQTDSLPSPPKASPQTVTDENKAIHGRIEELDKKGKSFFKNKRFLEAAQAFTEALELIDLDKIDMSSPLFRQSITLMNNRSAMYEKGGMPELALEDCAVILDKDANHSKARTRKLRILESLNRWNEALQEVCAIQLLFMQANRTNLRMGLPVPSPPVPQSKMEEILAKLLPNQVETYVERLDKRRKEPRGAPLPSPYTILQLLRSYSGFNSWMAEAAKDGSVETLTAQMPDAVDTATTAARASLLMKRGRRNVYDRNYENALSDFEDAYVLVHENESQNVDDVIDVMENGNYARLLEWTAMVRHWSYKLESALVCYQKCSDLEPLNALILVKQAGVFMDAGKHDEALKLFDTALGLDPACADALLHRSNLRMLQGKPDDARKDLEMCLKLKPNHVMSRLRLASILAAQNDMDGSQKQLDMAEQQEPSSSEVQSYRGELYFTQGKMDEARQQFEKAMKTEPNNPTPYVNAALALLNTPPPPGQVPDAQAVMRLLEQAISADPQFSAAYIQLGQLKLGTAVNLDAAREVIQLYDQGLEYCRSPEEIKELCSMRALAAAQVEAATMLKMETFNMQ